MAGVEVADSKVVTAEAWEAKAMVEVVEMVVEVVMGVAKVEMVEEAMAYMHTTRGIPARLSPQWCLRGKENPWSSPCQTRKSVPEGKGYTHNSLLRVADGCKSRCCL